MTVVVAVTLLFGEVRVRHDAGDAGDVGDSARGRRVHQNLDRDRR